MKKPGYAVCPWCGQPMKAYVEAKWEWLHCGNCHHPFRVKRAKLLEANPGDGTAPVSKRLNR